MKLAKLAFLVTLLMLALMTSMSAQTLRSEKDPRNLAPTVGTGGTVGGPTGLFTVYDGQTLRKGEWTLSIAYSNFDRDPGNVDITEVPLSFNIGLNDYLELFFTTDGFRALKVNSPRNLSSFYLPNSQLFINGALRSGPAIVQAPQGTGTSQFPGWAIFRPTGTQPFVQFPYVGGSAGNYQFSFPSGGVFGFPAGSIPTLGPPVSTGASANFPGIGSIYGSILPGVVLATTTIPSATGGNNPAAEVPLIFTVAPTYLPDAPFINRTYGTSAFGTFSAGAKWRWTGPTNPIGVGLIGYYQWYNDSGNDPAGWNQLQRGASAGGSRGDIALVLFGDARVRKWMNISANLGYKYTSKVKAEFPTGDFTVLDRPDELYSAFAVDFPVNRYFQPILEFRSTQYVGGRTPNAFENSPMDGIAGIRVYPTRWMSIGAAYRYHFNQQDRDSFENSDFSGTVTVTGRLPQTITTTINGVPTGFNPSTDPHGFIFQVSAGRRNKVQGDIPRVFANVDSVTLSNTRIVIPCPPGMRPVEGQSCPEGSTVTVGTKASSSDATDVLTYNYTVSGGRIVGSGANVTWDLSGVRPGTYTITAGADNGCGVCGNTKTETITVEECKCESPCICPTLDVSGGGVVESGQPMSFTANLNGGSGTDYTYNWNVSAGTISSGQGTPSITVDTTGLANNTNITATVDVGGSGLCATCPSLNGSETGSITVNKPEKRLFDEFGKLPDDEVKIRIENLYRELGNSPGSQGYIINYGTDREIAARERQIQKAITFLRQDASRVTIVRGGANPNGAGVWTKVWIVPSGADNPTP
jgi:hypothetical protein